MLCLKVPTDAAWADEAMCGIETVLCDHAHCELKAASNALSLAARHPEDLEIVRALAELAREETEHFQRVLCVMAARGLALGPPSVDAYAARLRRAAYGLGRSPGGTPLVDRLLVAALIEARSCERFKVLAAATALDAGKRELHSLWSELLASEAGHYRTFVDLALRAAGTDRGFVSGRLERLAEAEGEIVGSLARDRRVSRATIHG
jgi:tRNA-(ms[2]io[6]A)-hydroxylase